MSDVSAFEAFRQATESPMVIVTTAHHGKPGSGCLVGFSTQCSMDPVRFLVCLSKTNVTTSAARDAKSVVVHVLHDAEHDRELARLFGEQTEHDTDKLAQCS